MSAEDAPEGGDVAENTPFQSFMHDVAEGFLDCLGCVGRTAKASATGIATCAGRTAYPVKQGVFVCVDNTDQHYRPYLRKRPVPPNVPTFAFGASTTGISW